MQEPPPSLADRSTGRAEGPRHGLVAQSLGTPQDDARPQGQRLRRLSPSQPALQFLALLFRDLRDLPSMVIRYGPPPF